jgi:hypothetical protein
MFSGNTVGVAAFAAAIAASFWSSGPALAGELSAQKDVNAYLPIQSMSYEFGSKAMRGYFVSQGSVCVVTLMIIERSDLESPSPKTATRVRLMLDPGQIAGLDSEEGRSLNFTCEEEAASLVVDYGERSQLMAQQGTAISNTVAERVER